MSFERHTVSGRRVAGLVVMLLVVTGGLVGAASVVVDWQAVAGAVEAADAAEASPTPDAQPAADEPDGEPTGDAEPTAVATPADPLLPSLPDEPYTPGEHSAETTPEELIEATQVAADFVAAYTSYRYDDEPGATAERTEGLTTPELAELLAQDRGGAAGRAELEAREEVVTAVVETVQRQGGGGGWVDLAVVVRQDVVTTEGGTSRWSSYLTRVMRTGDGWRVAGFQP